jgi:hypothetical protein
MLTDETAASLLAATPRPREAVAEARSWLLDCFGDEPEAARQIRYANAVRIVKFVERHYDGGWNAFADSGF